MNKVWFGNVMTIAVGVSVGVLYVEAVNAFIRYLLILRGF